MNYRTYKRLIKGSTLGELREVCAFFSIFDGIDLSLSTSDLRKEMLKRLNETKTAKP